MSRYRSATWKPIATRSSRAVQKDLLSLHTCVGSGLGTWSYFDTGAGDRGVYSHIVVCGIWGSDAGKGVDGLALQMQDTDLRAAANLNGNWHVIAVETADNAARPIQPWTPAQQDSLVRIMVEANQVDGIPLALVPDSKPGRRGIAYHRQGCDPYRVDGGELWSEAYGKDCPTQARIDQIPGLIDRARRIVAGQPDPTAGGDDTMTPEDRAALIRGIVDAVWAEPLQGELGAPERAGQLLVRARVYGATGRDLLPGISARAVSTVAALGELLGRPAADVDEAALAAELAPLLPSTVGTLSDDTLSAIARAVADEQGHRLGRTEIWPAPVDPAPAEGGA